MLAFSENLGKQFAHCLHDVCKKNLLLSDKLD